MTEPDWLSSTDPNHLLKWLQKSKRHRPTRRKLTLFACACASRLGERVKDASAVRGLSLAERMAEGTATEEEVQRFHSDTLYDTSDYIHIAVWTLRVMEPDNVTRSAPETAARSAAGYVAIVLGPEEPAEQCRLLRDILGNPYRPFSITPSLLTDSVLGIARGIYQERAFERMPILGDALEEIGVNDEAVLAHCRADTPHARGCHVIDAILGKA